MYALGFVFHLLPKEYKKLEFVNLFFHSEWKDWNVEL